MVFGLRCPTMPRSRLPEDLIHRIREAAHNRCGYCLSPQRLVMARLKIDHIILRSRGGTDDESNLWLSCPLCNRHKSDRISACDPETLAEVALFHPRLQRWSDHFRWSDDGLSILGLTPTGRATVAALRLDDGPGGADLPVVLGPGWVASPDRGLNRIETLNGSEFELLGSRALPVRRGIPERTERLSLPESSFDWRRNDAHHPQRRRPLRAGRERLSQ